MPTPHTIHSIIWDFDGTLADTGKKNLNVTRMIVKAVTGRNGTDFQALRSLELYNRAIRRVSNWRQLYQREFGLTEPQTDAAGSLWTKYQLMDNTPVPVFHGIIKIINALGKYPNGIVSQNSKSSIQAVLNTHKLSPYFEYIVGHEEVGFNRQKPEPDGLLRCAEQLSRCNSGTVFYIGDHETDAECASRAKRVLETHPVALNVVSIGVFYEEGLDDTGWQTHPDFKARCVEDILDIVNGVANG
jgi:N-acetyl-D-muramate 6-phosphate phosphatase